MKKLITTSILAALVALGTTVMAQEYPDEYLGLPGDNLNLYAVMKLFQESETLEGFERNLNAENSRINNLDLNGDNLIDYITVSDYVDGNVHTIVLRAALNKNENQDVAVFTVQRFNDGTVQIQLIGDEDLYGKNYIIEPIYDETPNPGYTGKPSNTVNVTVVRTSPYEIARWPLISFIYQPDYSIWHSSWYWGYYPSYWNPWRPFYWHYYYGYHYNWYNDYYGHYRHWQHPRYTRYNDFYYSGIRAHSTEVRSRINDGQYKTTYSHPEQRREGEDLYSRVNPGQPRRAESTSVRSPGEKSGSQPDREMTNAPRTPSTKGTDRQVGRPSQERTKDAYRGSTPPSYGRTNTRPPTSQGTESARTSRQSAPKAESRPAQSQRSESARTSRQSASKSSPAASRSSRESRSGTTKSEKSRETKSKTDSRR